MKLISLEYNNKALDWMLEKTRFDTINLFVGVSGSGKTQILRAIESLKEIAHGASVSGLEWSVEFADLQGNVFYWEGKYEDIGDIRTPPAYIDSEVPEKKPRMVREILRNGKENIARRENDTIYFNEQAIIPKLSPSESLIYLFKEEDSISPISEGFRQIFLNDQSVGIQRWFYDVTAFDPNSPFQSAEEIILPGFTPDFKFTELCARVAYVQKGANETFVEEPYSIVYRYLQLPVLLKATFGDGALKPYFFAGPEIGLKLSATQTGKYFGKDTTVDFPDSILRNFNIGIFLGAGISYSITPERKGFSA